MTLRSHSSLRHFLLVLVLVTGSLCLAACDTGEGNTLASLRIVDASGNQATGILEIPRCVPTQVRVFGTFDDGAVEDMTRRVSLVWSSDNAMVPISNGEIGSEFAKGVVTASGAVGGTAMIRAEFGALSATQEVRIQSARLEISTAQSQTAIGDLRLPIFLTGIFGDPGSQTRVDISERVEWQSSAETVATVEAQSFDGRTQRFFIVPEKTATDGTVDTVTITADTGITACGVDGRPSFALRVHNKALSGLMVTPAGPLTLPPQVSRFLTVRGQYGDFSQDVTGLVRYRAVDPANPSQPSLAASFSGNRAVSLAQGIATLTTRLDQFGEEGDGTNDVAGNDVTLNVTNASLQTLAIDQVNPGMIVNTTRPFTATGTFSDSSVHDLSQDVFWSSSDTDIAVFSILQRNLILALDDTATAGDPVIVTALRGGFCDTDAATALPACPTTNLTTDAALSALAITDSSGNDCASVTCTVTAGDAAQLKALGTLAGGGTQELTDSVIWTSSDTSRAIINNAASLTGRVLGLTAGTVTINARFGAVSRDITLTVQ